MKPLLVIRNLKIGFRQRKGIIYAVNGINLEMYKGETLAIVGESGCGKSLTAFSIMGLLGPHVNTPNAVIEGSILFDDGKESIELTKLTNKEHDIVRGSSISMIFQEPMTALNPLFTVGDQVAEMFIKHKGMNRHEAMEATKELFGRVGISDAEKRIRAYPFQLSGGQLQRIMIAMAMSCEPKLLVADEPTTALDVTIQNQILFLLKQIKLSRDTAIMFITHNLGIVAQFADKIAVMYRGTIVERGNVKDIFLSPHHPYTSLLLKAVPKKGLRATQGDRLEVIKGTVPSPFVKIEGCPFHPRCPYRLPECSSQMPQEDQVDSHHMVRCFLKEVMK